MPILLGIRPAHRDPHPPNIFRTPPASGRSSPSRTPGPARIAALGASDRGRLLDPTRWSPGGRCAAWGGSSAPICIPALSGRSRRPRTPTSAPKRSTRSARAPSATGPQRPVGFSRTESRWSGSAGARRAASDAWAGCPPPRAEERDRTETLLVRASRCLGDAAPAVLEGAAHRTGRALSPHRAATAALRGRDRSGSRALMRRGGPADAPRSRWPPLSRAVAPTGRSCSSALQRLGARGAPAGRARRLHAARARRTGTGGRPGLERSPTPRCVRGGPRIRPTHAAAIEVAPYLSRRLDDPDPPGRPARDRSPRRMRCRRGLKARVASRASR